MRNLAWILSGLGLALVLSNTCSASLIHFSTAPGGTSWTAKKVGTDFELSFNNLIVDNSEPVDPVLVGDKIELPKMLLQVVSDNGTGLINATLTPIGEVTVRIQDAALGDLLVTQITSSVLTNIWNSLMGYPHEGSDLYDVTVVIPGHSPVLDELGVADAFHSPIDFAFSGSAMSQLYPLLHGTSTKAVSGVMSGHIYAIPEPTSAAIFGLALLVCKCFGKRRSL